ncbi:sulfotransferase family protein [Qipengyuania sp.]|uniref:sulfotransferase family protein n=1 Tax=Qipengyuania sp. TaxID=2004515 RepID=UPI003AF966BE
MSNSSRTDRQPHLVIVTGCQRSGTSLVGQIVGAHPQALLLDEDEGVMRWARALLAGDPRRHLLLPGLLARAAEKYRDDDPRIVRRPLRPTALHPDITHLVLKAPNLTYSHAAIARLPGPVSIINPVRDVRAVVASMGRLKRTDIAANQLHLLRQDPVAAATYADEIAMLEDPGVAKHLKRALVWRIKSSAHAHFARAGLDPLVFRYEDCVADPRAFAERIAAHVGLPFTEAMVGHAEVLQGDGPGELDRERPIDRSSLGKWQQVLGPREERAILDLVGDAMEELGYDRTPLLAKKEPAKGGLLDQRQAPVVVTGRGGSGTRLISGIVQQCGVFLGNQLNVSADSLEWVDTIYPIAVEKHAADGNPSPDLRASWTAALRRTAERIRSEGKLSDDALWGFKLPEAMLIMPELLEAFPSAKVIHLVRHPVTSSLRRTHVTSRTDNIVGEAVCAAAYRAVGRDPALAASDPDWRRNAITWHYQVDPVARLGKRLGPERYLEISFEELCADPTATRQRVLAFLGREAGDMPPIPVSKRRAATRLWLRPQKKWIWDLCGETARMLGYGPI